MQFVPLITITNVANVVAALMTYLHRELPKLYAFFETSEPCISNKLFQSVINHFTKKKKGGARHIAKTFMSSCLCLGLHQNCAPLVIFSLGN